MARNSPKLEEIDVALRAFHRGYPGEFDRLLGDDDAGGPGVCGMLFDWKQKGEERAERLKQSGGRRTNFAW